MYNDELPAIIAVGVLLAVFLYGFLADALKARRLYATTQQFSPKRDSANADAGREVEPLSF